MTSALMVSAQAKSLLKQMLLADGVAYRLEGGARYQIGNRVIENDEFQCWDTAMEELVRLHLAEPLGGGRAFEVTSPGAKSGVMYLRNERDLTLVAD